eukprot:CAMPEP_0204591808 /NCGR_PEP_ID=MMETSP0661-20131031/50572_1 /ASSEMBLY_ACC=CAM_ASM_000606 /TAXON_ID=109239 /ORGANISM="Alexandrium margalefi, Strain AMGDE01CS-322" /LENGTH=332 /DNA_ID=CAMNT_0051601965 /DNA_START=46 /DNA_END=1040 /DNA_ORIENTATION=+
MAAAAAALACGLLCLAAGQRVEMPLEVHPIPKHFHGFERYFQKYVSVFAPAGDDLHGVQVVATKGVPDEKALRVANVLAEFLDNDADGKLDNEKVVREMQRHGSTMIMFADQDELESSGFDEIPGYDVQDVEGDETGRNRTLLAHVMTAHSVGPEHACRHRPELICDAPLEEVFHLVTDTGYANAYPKEFAVKSGSDLAITMDTLIGNCGFAGSSPLGRHSSFHFPHCQGKYHYSDDTCEYGCLMTEYFHHFIASINGEYPWGRGNMCGSDGHRASEWELCLDAPDGNLTPSRELLRSGDPDGFGLITDPEFRVPQRMPLGRYAPPGLAAAP